MPSPWPACTAANAVLYVVHVLGSLVLACRSGCAPEMAASAIGPFSVSSQRQMHHCGRSISGANARGSFAKSACCVIGFCCVAHDTSPRLVRRHCSSNPDTAGLFQSLHQGTPSSGSPAGCAGAVSSSIGSSSGCVAFADWPLPFGGGIRTRDAALSVPRKSTIVENNTMTRPFQPSQESPKAPLSVRMFVLFSGRPRSSSVNQTISFRSFSAPWPMSATVTFLMRSFRSPLMSAARKYFDLIEV